ncbi:MAG: DinB family protein [Chloroflexota bacterium]|nr:DinB family protein [Chloroflexota bacterium]
MIESYSADHTCAKSTSASEWTEVPILCEPSTGASLDVERAELLAFLTSQRQSVLAIVDGLNDVALRQTVVPSGWTPLGMIEHLAYAERFWFQHVVSGEVGELPWPASKAEEEDGPFTSSQTVDAVLAFYRDQCARSDAVLTTTPLTAAPRGQIPPGLADLARDARTIVLHMIEETARHAGHLDVARELIDGRTGLGSR